MQLTLSFLLPLHASFLAQCHQVLGHWGQSDLKIRFKVKIHFKEVIPPFFFYVCLISLWRSTLKEKNLLPLEQILFCTSRHLLSVGCSY